MKSTNFKLLFNLYFRGSLSLKFKLNVKTLTDLWILGPERLRVRDLVKGLSRFLKK